MCVSNYVEGIDGLRREKRTSNEKGKKREARRRKEKIKGRDFAEVLPAMEVQLALLPLRHSRCPVRLFLFL